jgi:hypothetical protein
MVIQEVQYDGCVIWLKNLTISHKQKRKKHQEKPSVVGLKKLENPVSVAAETVFDQR